LLSTYFLDNCRRTLKGQTPRSCRWSDSPVQVLSPASEHLAPNLGLSEPLLDICSGKQDDSYYPEVMVLVHGPQGLPGWCEVHSPRVLLQIELIKPQTPRMFLEDASSGCLWSAMACAQVQDLSILSLTALRQGQQTFPSRGQ
jgi:hypothetical protein